MKSSSWITLLVSALISASIWALTPLLTIRQEPWDIEGNSYVAAFLIAAALTGFIRGRILKRFAQTS